MPTRAGQVGARLLPGETRVRAARPGTTPARALTEQSGRRTGRGKCARPASALGETSVRDFFGRGGWFEHSAGVV